MTEVLYFLVELTLCSLLLLGNGVIFLLAHKIWRELE